MNQRPVILMVSPGPVDGYPPVQNQAVLFVRRGFHVVLLTSPLAGQRHVAFANEHVTVCPAALQQSSAVSRLVSRLAFAARLVIRRILHRGNLVAEISFDTEGFYFSERCPFRSHIRIAHLHEALIDPEHRRLEQFAIRVLHRFDRIVVADRRRGELLKSQLQLHADPAVLPNYPLKPRGDAERSFEEISGEFRVGYAGSIGLHQGFEAIIRSIPKWTPEARLFVAGNPRTPEALQMADLARSLGVDDRVSFEGLLPLPEVVPFLQSCHLGLTLLCPVHDQWRFAAGASNKRYQCMQAGIAQISDTNPDVPELIADQQIGRCVDPGDADAIADAVNYFASHPLECREFGQRAYELYKSQYHYEIPFEELAVWIDRESLRRAKSRPRCSDGTVTLSDDRT